MYRRIWVFLRSCVLNICLRDLLTVKTLGWDVSDQNWNLFVIYRRAPELEARSQERKHHSEGKERDEISRTKRPNLGSKGADPEPPRLDMDTSGDLSPLLGSHSAPVGLKATSSRWGLSGVGESRQQDPRCPDLRERQLSAAFGLNTNLRERQPWKPVALPLGHWQGSSELFPHWEICSHLDSFRLP